MNNPDYPLTPDRLKALKDRIGEMPEVIANRYVPKETVIVFGKRPKGWADMTDREQLDWAMKHADTIVTGLDVSESTQGP